MKMGEYEEERYHRISMGECDEHYLCYRHSAPIDQYHDQKIHTHFCWCEPCNKICRGNSDGKLVLVNKKATRKSSGVEGRWSTRRRDPVGKGGRGRQEDPATSLPFSLMFS